MKPNIILILVMGGIILIMGASSHPTSKEPLYSLLNINNMLEQSKFLVSFDCQNEKFCEELIITYRTEELKLYPTSYMKIKAMLRVSGNMATTLLQEP